LTSGSLRIACSTSELSIGLEPASALDLSLERWSLQGCAEPLAEATGVKLLVESDGR
jgi:exopolyphosphatase/guanosine-5'-triphosphate,3'-diphosphate pyrophosphatase